MKMRTMLRNRMLLTLAVLALSVAGARAGVTTPLDGDMKSKAYLQSVMEDNINTMLELMNAAAEAGQRSIKIPKGVFTAEGAEELKSLWKVSGMSCAVKEITTRTLNTKTGFQVRGIPVDIMEADAAEARQELTIDLDFSGKISGVAISVGMDRYYELMAANKDDLDYSRRQIIVDFVENYRTAYNRRDLSYIAQVYSDNALIIDGHYVKSATNGMKFESATKMDNQVVYFRYTKDEYLRKLKEEFSTNEYINVKFDDLEISRHPKYDDIYGVTLKQYWHTSKNNDVGYLFLMIDFHDTDNPEIQVRTWQPYKYANGRTTSRDEVFHLGSFKIVR